MRPSEIATMAAASASLSGVTMLGVLVGFRRAMRHLRDIRTVIIGQPERVAAGVVIPAVPSLGTRVQEAVTATQTTREEVSRVAEQQTRTLVLLQEHRRQPASVAHGTGA